MNKIERLMAIILALKKSNRLTARDLSEKFEVNIRTIYRDIEALSQMNIPIVSHIGNEGGYSLLDEYFISPVVFNKDEVFSLLLSQKLIDIVNIPGYNQYVNSAFLKIRNIISEDLEEEFNEIDKKIKFYIKEKTPTIEDFNIFSLIKNSLESNLKIKIKYFNPHRLEVSKRTIHPYELVFEDGAWYIIAYCELREDKRWFRLDRIKDISILDERFNVIGEYKNTDYSMENIYLEAQMDENNEEIVLKFTKELYYIVKDYYYFKYGDVNEYDDHFIVKVRSDKPDIYINLGFKFLDGMEILKPLHLREEFINNLEELYKKYNLKMAHT